MHGQFYRDFERSLVGKENSPLWLCSSGLNGETESLITASQDSSTQHACSSEDRGQQDVESEDKNCASYN
jgi:hypothetical protein